MPPAWHTIIPRINVFSFTFRKYETLESIRRVVEPADLAALAVHIMVNTALTGATYDIDGRQQLVGG